MVVFYSATSNSRFIANAVADRLKDKITDCGRFLPDGSADFSSEEKAFVFVCPTYAWRIPHIFEKFIRASAFPKDAPVYFIMTCGGEIGNAGKYIEELCKEKNFIFKGVASVKMPENYIALFSAPTPEIEEKIIDAAIPVIDSLCEKISANKSFEKQTVSIADKLKSGIISKFFCKHIISAKHFYATDKCVGCGKCENVCPMNNIRLNDGKPDWNDACTHCMACISSCPEQAIEYGNKTKGKRRYICRDYT